MNLHYCACRTLEAILTTTATEAEQKVDVIVVEDTYSVGESLCQDP